MNEAVWKAAEEKIGMAKNQSYGEFWLGMNDLKDGTYRYVSDGNEVVDGMWKKALRNSVVVPVEPTNGDSEHCVCYNNKHYPAQWYDLDCSYRKMSICVLTDDGAGEKETGSRDTGEHF